VLPEIFGMTVAFIPPDTHLPGGMLAENGKVKSQPRRRRRPRRRLR